jgi:hypothetical protein
MIGAIVSHRSPAGLTSYGGACKNLIKDRMDAFGMRWTEQMAEAIAQL